MMSEQQITARLKEINYGEDEIQTALNDVGQMIITRTAAAYFSRLPQDEQEKLKGLSQEDVQAYLAEPRDSLAKMSQEEFEKIHDGTWEEYFEAMSQ
jgi:hypothetical protein